MKKLLLVIDYQNDFVAPEGILTAGEPAQILEPHILKRVEDYLAEGQDILFTLDTHDMASWDRHPESAAFAPHCLRGSEGWQVYGGLAPYAEGRSVEKSAYCPPFALLEAWVAEYDSIELLGVCTDICVLQTAVGLYTAKADSGSAVRLSVDKKGCASFDQKGHEYALDYMHRILQMEGEE